MAEQYPNFNKPAMALDCRFKRDLPYVGDDTGNSGNPNKVGLDPRIIDREAILALGHPASPIKAIRAKCIDCCGGSEGEARKCTATDCPLWPLRMGKNVYHAKASGHG